MTDLRAPRIAALLFIADLGFALGAPPTLDHLARTGELPMTPFGFRSLSGPFEQLGWDAFTVLGWLTTPSTWGVRAWTYPRA